MGTAEAIRRLVAAAPPLSDGQISRLAQLLIPADHAPARRAV